MRIAVTETKYRARGQAGFTLLETMLAVAILLVGLMATVGVARLFSFITIASDNQAASGTRCAEYAQDKMEALLALSFNDGSTNTTTYPASSTGGTGLGGTMAASSTVPTTNPGDYTNPQTNYSDCLTTAGAQVSCSGSYDYVRVWSIQTDSTARIKTITVVVAANTLTGGAAGVAPTVTLVCQKVNLS